MRKFKVIVRQQGFTRSIPVIAACSIDALLSVAHTLNPNEPSRVLVQLA